MNNETVLVDNKSILRSSSFNELFLVLNLKFFSINLKRTREPCINLIIVTTLFSKLKELTRR
jgi:hypothetical protein